MFGGVAVVVWLTTMLAGLVIRPTRRGTAIAAGTGVVVGIVAGLAAADWAAG